jgi:hypothetical protein
MQDYFNAVLFTGGTPNIIVRYLPLNLTGIARQWLNDLPEKSIQNWFDMEDTFKNYFEGTYRQPQTAGDLQRCKQKNDETSGEFLACWLEMKNSCEGIKDETTIPTFIGGLEKGSLLRHTLMR